MWVRYFVWNFKGFLHINYLAPTLKDVGPGKKILPWGAKFNLQNLFSPSPLSKINTLNHQGFFTEMFYVMWFTGYSPPKMNYFFKIVFEMPPRSLYSIEGFFFITWDISVPKNNGRYKCILSFFFLEKFSIKRVNYRNWYQDWGRWWRNNDRNGGINFYSIMMKQNQLQINKRMQGKCSKLPQNCLSYSMVTCAQLAIVQWSHVTWLFLPGNTCSNHCDVKTRFVTLNFSHTLHKNNWQNTHYNSW